MKNKKREHPITYEAVGTVLLTVITSWIFLLGIVRAAEVLTPGYEYRCDLQQNKSRQVISPSSTTTGSISLDTEIYSVLFCKKGFGDVYVFEVEKQLWKMF